jgi:hypothetical protein
MFSTRVLAIAVALLLSTGCVQNGDRPLSDSLLVDLLVDLHIVDAGAQMTDTTGLAQRRDSVFDAHSTSERAFVRSMEDYRDDMDAYLRLYDAVLGRLSEKRLEETRRHDDTDTATNTQP